MKKHLFHALIAGLLLFTGLAEIHAQGTAFTYTGRLSDGGTAANGSYDLTFTVFAVSTSGTALPNATTTKTATVVSNGSFTVTLDFGGSVFTGADRWLEIGVRTNGSGAFTTLNTRQQITATPYAITAGSVTGPINGGNIVNGTISGAQLANGAISGTKLAAGSVTTAAIADGAITTAQLAPGSAAANLNAISQTAVPSGGMILSTNSNDNTLATAGYVKLGKVDLGDAWEQRAVTGVAPLARVSHTAIWTGSEMIIWGGMGNSSEIFNTGGRYNPTANSWTEVTTVAAPAARYTHTAVWTGTEMIIWGGVGAQSAYLNTGSRYNPASDSWSVVPPNGETSAPSARQDHTAVWTGSEMIIWGGRNANGNLGTGGRYNPLLGAWLSVSPNSAPESRYYHTAVWTGSEMIVWGGQGNSVLGTGGRYKPATDSWSAIASGSVLERVGHTAVWTGREMIIWGGFGNSGYINSGSALNPLTGIWRYMTFASPPTGRAFHSAVWTGSEMIIWGGEQSFGSSLNTGARYNPTSDRWTSLTTTNGAPQLRRSHTAIWSGTEMIVWGGLIVNFSKSSDGGRYNPTTDSWGTLEPTAVTPTARTGHLSLWTGSEMIVWGGGDSVYIYWFNNYFYPQKGYSDGGRYNPALNTWKNISPAGAPYIRLNESAVWTGNEMILWGGRRDSIYDNQAARCYSPASDTWRESSTVNVPQWRENHTTVWTGSEMIVFGGETQEAGIIFDNGGRYNPFSDTWTPILATGGPGFRVGHTAVWTGDEMIIWGGRTTYAATDTPFVNTGSRYKPTANSWTAVSAINAVPSARAGHIAVWTGTEMIIWSGTQNNNSPAYEGRRYNPTTDSWTFINNDRAPGRLFGASVVWTGKEMIIWGGLDDSSQVSNDGISYNPTQNRWSPIPLKDSPPPRYGHTAVWTGSEMIVWGGWNELIGVQGVYYSDGGRYDPIVYPPRWKALPATSTAPAKRSGHTAVWTGSEMIIWGGSGISAYQQTGARYNPTANSWIELPLLDAPTNRIYHTAVWSGSEMIIWGGQSVAAGDQFLKTGGRYDPVLDKWTATPVYIDTPQGRYRHTAIWANNQMIIWGGAGTSGPLNDGGIFYPSLNQWLPTASANAPLGRYGHTAIWTGSEMIVWGGQGNNSPIVNTGGRYNLNANTWLATSTNFAPSPRMYHTAVWTGTEMIIWGGDNGTNLLSTGAKYSVATGAWQTMNTVNAPEARYFHTAVWTGKEMLAWGGQSALGRLNSGGRYDSAANSWTPITTDTPPLPRSGHSAIWTGDTMVIWGGSTFNATFNDMWNYVPNRTMYLYQRP